MQTTPVVIDCDPGIDDVVALALAARSPEIDVRAVTTTYGNVELDKTNRNATIVLDLVGRSDVLVAPGSSKPLRRTVAIATQTHGESGVGYAPVGPAPHVDPNPTVLLDVLDVQPTPVVLVTLGPLTNLAHALERDSALVLEKTSGHIGMFGTVDERGRKDRQADFNAWSDPEAVECVLESGLACHMVGLDVTRQIALGASEVERLSRSPNALISWLAAALRFYVETHQRELGVSGCFVNDPLPIAEVISPGILDFETLRLGVDLDENEYRGHTVVRPKGAPTAVARHVVVPRMRSLLARVFGEPVGRSFSEKMHD
jgi:inosine-uridine nucleoside N-ribohydrolase